MALAGLIVLAAPALRGQSAELDADRVVVLARGPDEDVVVDAAAVDALQQGITIFQRSRAGDLLGSYPNERFENLARTEQLELFQAEQRFDDVFIDGDEVFEFEPERALGGGQGPFAADLPIAARPVHDGDIGGGDGASCRGCHFVGGPDGAGSSTQRALLRGDGHRVSTAVVRDAPHVMGLGYISRLAREMEADLKASFVEATDIAATTSLPITVPLQSKGVSFGELVARPGGSVDTSRVDGVASDLVIRPFGHKGRHADLPSLVDEALQVHLGIQTASRLSTFAGQPARIGSGTALDPDNDGHVAPVLVQDGEPGAEASASQSLLLAAYLSMLGVPEIHPPRSPDLLTRWARGRELFESTGCTLCHVERLPMNSPNVVVDAVGGFTGSLAFSLAEFGQEPRALRTDFAPGSGPTDSVPIFAFTDLKRHEMGTALSDAIDEVPPDGSDVVAASVWLTRSLWGVADTAPYLHDGRAATLDEAIGLHGGEAAGVRDAYLLLSNTEQASLRAFLVSLTRAGAVLVE